MPDQEQRRQQLASFPSLIGASTGAGRSGEAWRRSRWRRAAATQLGDLPEACLAQAIALTSPRDACRCAAVSPAFRAAADSDHVWRAFLPPQLDRAKPAPVPVLQPAPASRGKKEAYLGLCDAAVGEDGGCRVWLERATGARCYALSARRLSLPWDDGEFCWKFAPHPRSRSTTSSSSAILTISLHAHSATELLIKKRNHSLFFLFYFNFFCCGTNFFRGG